jgi:hypothetical protein
MDEPMWSSKAPYIVVIAIGAIAWAFSYFYNTIVQEPVVEVTTKTEAISVSYNGEQAAVTSLEICNLTFDKVFPQIVISIFGVTPHLWTVSAKGFADPRNVTGKTSSSSLQITIENVQPQVGYVVHVHHLDKERPGVSFDTGGQPLRFIARGLLTHAIRLSQEIIIYGLFAIPVVLLIFWVASRFLPSNRAHTSSSDDGHT